MRPDPTIRTIAGRPIRVLDAGRRDSPLQPLVLVHGLAGSLDNWHGLIEAYAPQRRVIALDLPGHGDSDKSEDAPYTIPHFAEIVRGVLDDAAVPRAIWVGNSMGGHVALEVALHHPAYVGGLVLVNSAGANVRLDASALPVDPRMFADASVELPRDFSVLGIVVPMLFSDPTCAAATALLEQQTAGMHSDEFPVRMRAVMRSAVAVIEHPLLDRLGDVRAPTLVVWGEDDRLLHRDNADALGRIPGARVVTIPRSGHIPELETPEAFHAALRPFLAGLA